MSHSSPRESHVLHQDPKQVTNVQSSVYGERIRMVLQDENKKAQLQTEIKMRRQQSSYKIARSSSGVEVRTVSNEDKIKMKKALGKINILASGTFECSQ